MEALTGATADAGSIPAASTFALFMRVFGIVSGNDSEVRILPAPASERLHVALEVAQVAMPVNAERGGEVRVAQRVRCRVDSGDAP